MVLDVLEYKKAFQVDNLCFDEFHELFIVLVSYHSLLHDYYFLTHTVDLRYYSLHSICHICNDQLQPFYHPFLLTNVRIFPLCVSDRSNCSRLSRQNTANLYYISCFDIFTNRSANKMLLGFL